MNDLLNHLFDMLLNVLSHLFLGLKQIAANIVGRILASFGLTLVTFNSLLEPAKAFLASHLNGLPSNALNLFSALGLDVAMTIIVSALSIRYMWKVFIIPRTAAVSMGLGS